MNNPGTGKLIVEHAPVTMDRLPFRRIIQERGELALIEDGEVFHHLACFTLKPGPGFFRGGHVHHAKVEHFYMLSGEGMLRWVDGDSGGKGTALLKEGDKVTILPGLAHRFEALHHLVVVEYYAGVHDPDDDIPFLSFE
jgi:mannose-6-phosphate isomerase-like protein (cupin superfamily)